MRGRTRGRRPRRGIRRTIKAFAGGAGLGFVAGLLRPPVRGAPRASREEEPSRAGENEPETGGEDQPEK
jgi:hypothetical protein